MCWTGAISCRQSTISQHRRHNDNDQQCNLKQCFEPQLLIAMPAPPKRPDSSSSCLRGSQKTRQEGSAKTCQAREAGRPRHNYNPLCPARIGPHSSTFSEISLNPEPAAGRCQKYHEISVFFLFPSSVLLFWSHTLVLERDRSNLSDSRRFLSSARPSSLPHRLKLYAATSRRR